MWALDDPVVGTHDRFRDEGERLAGALRTLGVDARVGEVPGEYCPGAYSVNARGRVKLIGTAQRLVRGGALLGASIVVGDGAGVRAVLDDVYAALEFDWDATTAGAIDEEVPGLSLDAVERAVIAAFGGARAGGAGRGNPRPRPPARTATTHLAARGLRVLLRGRAQLVGVLRPLSLARLGGVLRDLLAALERFLAGLLGAVDDVVGQLAELLVLDARRRDQHAGEEADRERADGEPERVLLARRSSRAAPAA